MEVLDHLFKKTTNGGDAPSKATSGCSNNNGGMPPAAAAALQFAPLMSAKPALISKPKPRDAVQSCCDNKMCRLRLYSCLQLGA